MDVRPVDPFDVDLLACYHEVCRRAELHERPWESIWSPEELRARFEHLDSTERSELFAAFDGDVLVGGGIAQLPLLDNTDKAFVHVMVDPQHRRRGAGSLMVQHATDQLRRQGRTMFLAESSYRFEDRETHGYRRFAEQNGFRIVNTEVVRVLGLPVADGLLEALAREAGAHHAGYRIETFTSDLPERYLESYCEAHNHLATDAPSGEVDYEAESMTPESFRQAEKRLHATGRTRLSTVALTPEDQVVAYTDLVVKADPSQRVQQWGTLVDRRHRGHRLGTAVKVANLVALQETFPGRSEVVTSNAEVNQNMVGINDALGFEPVAVLPMFQRLL